MGEKENRFTWDEGEMDAVIRCGGVGICLIDGMAFGIQVFVERISNEVGKKCDWCYAGGRGVVYADGSYAMEMVQHIKKLIDIEKSFVGIYSIQIVFEGDA